MHGPAADFPAATRVTKSQMASARLTWVSIKRADYPGAMTAFLQHWFVDEAIEDKGAAAARHAQAAAMARRRRRV